MAWKTKLTFNDVCTLLAARRCYDHGHTVDEIAISAKKPKTTIRRWLKKSGLYTVPNKKKEILRA